MKKLLLLLSGIIITNIAISRAYYFSNTLGDDSRTSTQAQNSSTPWKSLSKLQSFYSSLVAGDSVLFQRGNEYYGTVTVSKNGIYIGQYGSGSNATWTGLSLITGWTANGNVYTSNAAASTLSTLNVVVINGINAPIGRTPNTGYWDILSTNGSTTITDATHLNAATLNWTGATVSIRELMYEINRRTITSASGATITFTTGSPKVGWGYFIQNDIRTLDVATEWAYLSDKKIAVYSTSGTPTSVYVPTLETGLLLNGYSNTKVEGIKFKGYNSYGINCQSAAQSQSGTNISYCFFEMIGQDGIYAYPNSHSLTVNGGFFSENNNKGINAASSDNAVITNNILENIGNIAGMGQNGDDSYTGIVANGDGSRVQYNDIFNAGYCGIRWDGNSTNISYNKVENATYIKDDGGGIYCFSVQAGNVPFPQTTRTVSYNTVLNCPGAAAGSGISGYKYQGAGVYADGQSANINIFGNTIGNINAVTTGNYGIFQNGGRFINTYNNTVYNWRQSMYVTKVSNGGGSLNNATIQNNIFCSPTTVSDCDTKNKAAEYLFDSTALPLNFTASGNVYANPLNTSAQIYGRFSSGQCYTLPQWQTATGKESGSTASPTTVSDVSKILFLTNYVNGTTTVSLGQTCIDLRNNSYPGTITLQPFQGVILLKTGTANTAPTCTAIPSATITLPTNSVSLNGVAASTMGGSIVSWSWEKTSGPATGSITNSTSQVATAVNLVQGTYVFTVTATDNNGLTCTATKSVTVNAALVVPTANAGSNQTITLPTNSVTLSGSGSGGTITSYLWSLLSGPCVGCNFSAPTSASTNFTGLIAGIYSVRFRVGNDDGNFGYDTVQITVNPAPVAPTCSAGTTPVTITLPTNTVGLSATGSGVNSVSFLWERTSGPLTATIVSPTSASTTATGLANGTHTFRITVTDNVNGLTCQSTKTVTVNSAPNIPPVVTVSDNQIITLPTNSVTVSGSAVISSGTLASYLWEYVSGPVTYTITSPATASTTITGLVAGTYRFSLKVTDSNGLIGRDTLIIQVNAAGTEYIPGIRALNASVISSGVQMMFAVDKPTDMQYFIIQKKTTGSYTNLSSQIKPSLAPIYKYFDANPTTGDSFYRVKALEKNGKTWYSNVVQIKKN